MTKFYTGTLTLLFACANAQARCSPGTSGMPNDLQSAQQLDSGVGPALGDSGVSKATMSMGVLLGYRVVYDSDYQETKRDIGEITDNSIFREDLNADGPIHRNDARLVRRKNGSTLLP